MTKQKTVGRMALLAAGLLALSPACTPTPSAAENTALELAHVDSACHPGENFFLFSNGRWLANNPVPPAESRWGSFNELEDKNLEILRGILDKTKDQAHPEGSNGQKLASFYRSGMDSAAIQQAGLSPLAPALADVKANVAPNNLSAITARMHKLGSHPLFAFYIDQDAKNSTHYAAYLYQSGLGLPDRDYYLDPSERFAKTRGEYEKYITRILELSGSTVQEAAKEAKAIVALETELARVSMTREDRRNPDLTYNPYKLEDLQKETPAFDWAAYFREAGNESIKTVVAAQPDYLKKALAIAAKTDANTLQAYYRFHLASTYAPYLSNEFEQANFQMYRTVLAGVKEMQPRWKRVLNTTDRAIGEILGQEYVKEAFSPQAKQRALEMVGNLKLALEEHIAALDWMSEGTKERAQHKLSTFVVKIGYPDKWKDYSRLTIKDQPYAANVMAVNQWDWERVIGRPGQPVDRTEWFMSPQTINAYYNPSMNEIVFPAGILQPPFFNAEADDAVNYGGIGAVIGHEFTHGFDDQGRKFDADGNLNDWWEPADTAAYNAKARVLVEQFNQYVAIDSLTVNGKLTLGENIADLGGLTIAYTALQKSLAKNNPGLINGLTPDQRFFMSWGHIWRTNYTDEELKRRLLIDPHSPAPFRVNGPVSNMPQFYAAYGVQPGQPLHRHDHERAKVW